MLAAQRKIVTRLNSKPQWLWAFTLLSALSIIVYLLMHPFLVEATLVHLPSTATLAEKEIIIQTFNNELPLRSAFLPIRLLIGWSTFAFVVFLICKAFGPPEQVHFVKVFSLEVHAEIVNLLAQAATLVSLAIGNSTPANTINLVPFSVAAFTAPQDIVSFSLLNSLNFFTLLYIVLLTMGISILSGFARGKAFVVVLLAWLAYLLFNVATLKVLRDTMHLLI